MNPGLGLYRACGYLFLALLLACPAVTAADVQGYLRIPGITEGCGEPGHLNECVIYGLTHTLGKGPGSGNGGAGADRSDVTLTVVKAVDRASPLFLGAAAKGAEFKTGSVTWQPLSSSYAIGLDTVVITGVNEYFDPYRMEAGDPSLEAVTLQATAVSWVWKPDLFRGWNFNTGGAFNEATRPPGTVRNLRCLSVRPDSITWVWTDPADIDLAEVRITLDGTYREAVDPGTETWTAYGLNPDTSYRIGITTADQFGNVNANRVYNTASTSGTSGEPLSIEDLHNTSYLPGYTTWAWTNPPGADYNYIHLFVNNQFYRRIQGSCDGYTIPIQNRAGLENTLSTRTEKFGTLNQTWVNNTSRLAPPYDTVPPASVTNLHNTTYLPDQIAWSWTIPADPDFDYVLYRLDNGDPYTVRYATGIAGVLPDTEHTISTRTVDTSGNMALVWVNNTSRTAPA